MTPSVRAGWRLRRLGVLMGALLAVLVAASSAQASHWRDSDGDGVRDGRDNCPQVANRDQRDADRDGKGDACDADRDGDDVDNDEDNCPDVANRSQSDDDGDGVGNACDSDRDGDGRPNGEDNCPDTANPGQRDSDQDGEGDRCDDTPHGDRVPEMLADVLPLEEDDGDGKPDAEESKNARKPVRKGPLAPRLSSLSLSRRTALVCLSSSRRARRRCRPRLVAVVYSLDRAATVRATLSRWSCGRGRCGWRSLGHRDVESIRGRSAFTIGRRFGGRRLRRGRYSLVLTAREDGLKSGPASATFRVRG